MSHICIGLIISNHRINRMPEYHSLVVSVCHKYERFVFFPESLGAEIIQEPLMSHFSGTKQDYLSFSIADQERFDNIEDLFTTCTGDGECWNEFQYHCEQLQGLLSEIREIIEPTETLIVFLGDSMCPYSDFEKVQVQPFEISKFLYDRTREIGYWDDNLMLEVATFH